jgi:cell wall-associated NlpC family hydrolase
MRIIGVYGSSAGQDLMKGRSRSAIILVAVFLLFAAAPGFSKNASNTPKTPAKQKNIKNATPASEPGFTGTYVIRQGDSLYRIAHTYKTTVESLKAGNGLKSSRLKIGQTLRIPGAQSPAPQSEPQKNAETASTPNEQAAIQYITQARDADQILKEEDNPLRLQLAEAGFKMIGVRYRRSGESQKTGFDCSGLVKNLFSKFNIELPRSSREQYKQGEKIDRDKLEIGDLVFFSSGGSNPTHVGIYVGNNKFLHAARKAQQVMVSDLNKIWYTMRYLGARRIADLWWDETDSDPEKK